MNTAVLRGFGGHREILCRDKPRTTQPCSAPVTLQAVILLFYNHKHFEQSLKSGVRNDKLGTCFSGTKRNTKTNCLTFKTTLDQVTRIILRVYQPKAMKKNYCVKFLYSKLASASSSRKFKIVYLSKVHVHNQIISKVYIKY